MAKTMPTTYQEVVWTLNPQAGSATTLETFNALKGSICQVLGDIARVAPEWVEVQATAAATARRRRRSLLQSDANPALIVKAKIHTDDVEGVRAGVLAAISDGSLAQRLAATTPAWTLQAESVQVATQAPPAKSSNIGVIAGASAAGAAVLGMLAGGFVMWRKRRAAPDDAMAADADGAPAFASEPPTMPPMAMMPTALDAPPAAPPSKSRRGRARGAPRGPDPLLTWMASQLPATPQPTSPLLGRWAMDFSKLQGMRPIGEGSFGRVYAATYDGAPVAAKVLVDTAAWQGDGPDSTALSMQAHMSNPSLVAPVEVTLMASMDHPNIVKFLGVCTTPPCIITEFCERGALGDLLLAAKRSPALAAELTWPRRIAMAVDAAEGMRHLHDREPPIVHRDLKSPNLVIAADYTVKVCDFNLSKILDGDSARSSSLAAMNPRWLAPELFNGESATRACDVFSFGVVLWELIAWDVPWGNKNPWTIVNTLNNGGRLEIPLLEDLPGPAPTHSCFDKYVALLESCWAQNPEARPTMGDVSAELRRIAQIA